MSIILHIVYSEVIKYTAAIKLNKLIKVIINDQIVSMCQKMFSKCVKKCVKNVSKNVSMPRPVAFQPYDFFETSSH